MIANKDIKKRIIEIAYKHKLGHLGSYFSCVDIIDWIFKKKSPEDIFILSNGHAALAQYVILEKYYKIDAEALYLKHGSHPHLDEENHIHCSTGSLGMGIAAAVGRALSNPKRTVHVMISDGECAEGVVWESLRYIADRPVTNMKIYVVHNGWGAYCEIPFKEFQVRIAAFSRGENIALIRDANTPTEQFSFLRGQNAHYHVMSEENYNQALDLLK